MLAAGFRGLPGLGGFFSCRRNNGDRPTHRAVRTDRATQRLARAGSNTVAIEMIVAKIQRRLHPNGAMPTPLHTLAVPVDPGPT